MSDDTLGLPFSHIEGRNRLHSLFGPFDKLRAQDLRLHAARYALAFRSHSPGDDRLRQRELRSATSPVRDCRSSRHPLLHTLSANYKQKFASLKARFGSPVFAPAFAMAA